MKINNKNAFNCTLIDGAYVASLVELINYCRDDGVRINTVQSYQNGWRVTFEDFSGVAVCHDESYGSPYYNDYFNEDKYKNDFDRTGLWETISFPWDDDNTSTHTAEELAFYLSCLKDGNAPWRFDNSSDILDDVDETNYAPYFGCDMFETDEVW